MKKEQENDSIKTGNATIFDDVHRTLLEKEPKLILPVINEVFRTDYPLDEPLVQLKNEHVDVGRRIITDSCIRVRDKLYHIESQSYPDGSMAVRMVEYDFFIALENLSLENGTYVIEFPQSCVLYLRDQSGMGDCLTLKVRFPGGETVLYKVPVVKIQKYTLEDIFEKNLLFFIPFYLMRHEKDLRNHAGADVYTEMINEYDIICETLSEQGEEMAGGSCFALLTELINRIAEYIIPEGENKERMVAHMGGQVLELEIDKALERGIERGIEQGIEQGIERGIKQGIEQGIERGIEQGIEQGIERGEARMSRLTAMLAADGRIGDIVRAADDVKFRAELLKEYQL